MSTEQLLDNAVDYIYEVVSGQDWICDALLDIPEEDKICSAYCQNFCKDCVLRFFKHYKNKKMNSKFYISFEAARLLKEKGYDIKRDFLTPVYNENGCLYWSNHEDLSDKIPAITKAEAIDWLESKGIVIEVFSARIGENRKWCYSIINTKTGVTIETPYKFTTRLEAEEAAIIKIWELS